MPDNAEAYVQAVSGARQLLGRPMTFTEKVLYAHLWHQPATRELQAGDYVDLRPDRVLLQDATAQMALLQLMNSGRDRVMVDATVHCDHLIEAYCGAAEDLAVAVFRNDEVYRFLQAAADKYGLGFWGPGSGISHQVVLENYAFPGGLIIGADSHTPNAGGLSMMGVGVGGSDTVDAMVGMEWELRVPRLIGVRLNGQLHGWASAKDVILHLAGRLGTKGATNAVLEYFGPGASHLTATGRATICNMGAELGATSSLFGYDTAAADYLRATGRGDVAALADTYAAELRADPEVTAHPEDFFSQVIDVDLDTLEPHVNGPFSPDVATPISQLAAKVTAEGWPVTVSAALVGSCTNSSYQDLARASAVAAQALADGRKLACPLYLNPGSARIEATAERDGLLAPLRELGAIILADACGPCIGQWHRVIDDPAWPNSIVTSFNRNFAKRADGNPNTHAFVASPQVVVALALAGRLDASLGTPPPATAVLPSSGFVTDTTGFHAPAFSKAPVVIGAHSTRLAALNPFAPWDGRPIVDAPLLVKVAGKCTTDHISPAGPWLAYRGNLARISDNLLQGAVNAFTGEPGGVVNCLDEQVVSPAVAARAYQEAGLGSVIVAEENYGEGSSREHAAMEPRFLGVRLVLAKSFARIHETNLKKQGLLACTFADPADYDRVQEGDRFSLPGLPAIAPGANLVVELRHSDGATESFEVAHTFSAAQIGWLRAGSALNVIAQGILSQQPN